MVDARFAKPLDGELIGAEIERQPVVFTLEDHVLAGGFGAAVASWCWNGTAHAPPDCSTSHCPIATSTTAAAPSSSRPQSSTSTR